MSSGFSPLSLLGSLWKPYALALAGTFLSFLAIVAAISLFGIKVRLHFLPALLALVLITAFFFLVFWGVFAFRSRLPLSSLLWQETLLSSFLFLPLVCLLSLPFMALGLHKALPAVFEISMPLIVLAATAECVSWRARRRARSATPQADSPSPEPGV